MTNEVFTADVVALDGGKYASIKSSKFEAGPEGECVNSEVKYTAQVTLWKDDMGNPFYLIQPCAKTGRRRYEPLLDTDHGSITTTKQDIRVVLKFPRKLGFITAARNLISESARIAAFLINFSEIHFV